MFMSCVCHLVHEVDVYFVNVKVVEESKPTPWLSNVLLNKVKWLLPGQEYRMVRVSAVQVGHGKTMFVIWMTSLGNSVFDWL